MRDGRTALATLRDGLCTKRRSFGRILGVLVILVVTVGGFSAPTVAFEPVGAFVFNPNYPVPDRFVSETTNTKLRFPFSIPIVSPDQLHTRAERAANESWTLQCARYATRNADGSVTRNPNWGSGEYCGGLSQGVRYEASVDNFGGADVVVQGGLIGVSGGCLQSIPPGAGCPVTNTVKPSITVTATFQPITVACYEETLLNPGSGPCPAVEVQRTTTMEIVPKVQGPFADFSFVMVDQATKRVQFTDLSGSPTGLALTYLWTFEDGATSTERSPTYTFNRTGTADVTLEVTDTNGKSATITKTVFLGNDLTVNSVGDLPAVNPSTRGCDTGGTVDGDPECTLRAAIQAANADGGGTIEFDIPGGASTNHIVPTSRLPEVRGGVTIDGTTQPSGTVWVDYPDGNLTFGTLTLLGVGSSVKGTIITGPVAVVLKGTGHVVTGNQIGLSPTGVVRSNSGIEDQSANSTITDNVVSADFLAIGAANSGSTISDNYIGVDRGGQASGDGPEIGFLGVGDVTFENNSVRGTNFAVELIPNVEEPEARAGEGTEASNVEGTKAPTVTGNRVNVAPDNTVFDDAGEGIRIDGAGGSKVTSNIVGTKSQVAIHVSGVLNVEVEEIEGTEEQYSIFFVPFDGDVDLDVEEVRGTDVTIASNRVVADDDTVPPFGIVSWAGATDVRITGNTVDRALQAAIDIRGGADHEVSGNQVGTPAMPTAGAIRVLGASSTDVGVAGAGNTIYATSASTGVLFDEASSGGSATGNMVMNADVGIGFDGGTLPVIRDNTVEGSDTGVLVTSTAASAVIENNTVRRNTTGIENSSVAARIKGNTSTGNGAGIVSVADDVTIENNTSTDNTDVGIQSRGADVTITGNTSNGDGVGIEVVGGSARVDDNEIGTTSGATDAGIAITGGTVTATANEVASTASDGFAVAPGATATLVRNRIYGSANLPIAAPGTPTAPVLTAAIRTIGRDAESVTTLVVTGLPAGDAGTVEVFANDSCADPEAKYVLNVRRTKPDAQTFAVIVMKGLANRDHFTATYTNAAGKTSQIGTCESVGTYPDSDGDGSVDPLDELVGSANDPKKALIATDTEDVLLVQTTAGQLGTVRIGDDPAPGTQPAGWSLPHGILEFTVDGVGSGGGTIVNVTSVFGADQTLGDSYAKYGPPAPGASAAWYDFTFDDARGTGARQTVVDVPGLGFRRSFELVLIDGQVGDSDSTANGSITDPGGPVVIARTDTGTTTTTTTTPPATTNPPPAPTTATTIATPAPPSADPPATTAAPTQPTQPPATTQPSGPAGTLPSTGSSAPMLAILGLFALALGLVLLGPARLRRS